MLRQLKMPKKKAFLSTVKKELEKSPIASSVVFCFILLCLEKIVEMDFACPCQPDWNAPFVAAYFIVPAVLIYLLMINIQLYKFKHWKNVYVSSVPAIAWIILMFLDGKYFACGMTSWLGKFEDVSKSSHLKWCEPDNHKLSKEYMRKTQNWFSVSQIIGMKCIVLLYIPLVYTIYKQYNKGKKDQESSTSRDLEASVPVDIEDCSDCGDIELHELK